MTVEALELSPELRTALLGHARAAAPREACGLLIGRRERKLTRVERVLALRNVALSRSAFEIEPLDVLAAERDALASGSTVVGAWHSHVDAPASPSPRDLAHGGYSLQLVVSLVGPSLRAWRGIEEIPLVEPPPRAT